MKWPRANLSQKYSKNRKRHRIWAILLSNLGRRPLLIFFSLRGTRPLGPLPPPPAFDAHVADRASHCRRPSSVLPIAGRPPLAVPNMAAGAGCGRPRRTPSLRRSGAVLLPPPACRPCRGQWQHDPAADGDLMGPRRPPPPPLDAGRSARQTRLAEQTFRVDFLDGLQLCSGVSRSPVRLLWSD